MMDTTSTSTSTSTSPGHSGDLDKDAAPSHAVIRRSEMIGATLNVGGQPIDLSEYATTGIVGVG